ncbi:MAG: hypothetical protein H6672_10395 [Anaerolineaceae bacterium]|nr:hypothetical protein [Anaerolineaceae bacterium]
MDNVILALLIGLGLGLVFAIPVARRSIRKEPIYGGALAHVFHYVGTAAFVSVLPTVLASLILRGGFSVAFPLAIGLLVVCFAGLFLFAVIERPARPQLNAEDSGWTKEDAQKSGL